MRRSVHLLVLVVSGLAEAGQLVVLSLRDERGVHGEDVAEYLAEALGAFQHPGHVVGDIA
jgi:hypothetical protein